MASLASPTDRRWIPVRLTDVPIDKRLRAAQQACKQEQGSVERHAILAAALDPSDRTYYVAP